VPSAFYARKLIEWGWDPRRFLHVPNFVDCGALHPSYEPGRAFLYFGRLSPEKGLLTLIRAAAQARVPLRLAGTGPDRARLEHEAALTGADATFLGHLSGERLHDEVRAARATVLPSEWYENGPISVLESLAAGKPAIGAAIGGIPEHITPGVDGWLFESGSVDDLAAVLRLVAELPDTTLARMGRAARMSAEQRFDIGIYRKRIAALYADLSRERASRSTPA
jgi:glycosyltransferase involved in cell wall biosynthesis